MAQLDSRQRQPRDQSQFAHLIGPPSQLPYLLRPQEEPQHRMTSDAPGNLTPDTQRFGAHNDSSPADGPTVLVSACASQLPGGSAESAEVDNANGEDDNDDDGGGDGGGSAESEGEIVSRQCDKQVRTTRTGSGCCNGDERTHHRTLRYRRSSNDSIKNRRQENTNNNNDESKSSKQTGPVGSYHHHHRRHRRHEQDQEEQHSVR